MSPGTSLFFLLVSSFSLFGGMAGAASTRTHVELKWTSQEFPLKIQVYEVQKQSASLISATMVVRKLKEAPLLDEVKGEIEIQAPGSRPFALVVQNTTDHDVYFFAVPHTLLPAKAAAGHFFECLCVGYVYRVPKNSVWYRIVRINLNENFQNISHFVIEHQIQGLGETVAKTQYREKIYNP